jgi:hypothetical protein
MRLKELQLKLEWMAYKALTR